MTTELGFEGMNELVAKLQELPDKVATSIQRKGAKESMQIVYDEAVSRAPVGDTGNLVEGIKLEVSKQYWGIKVNVASKAPHSHLVEYGHWLVSHAGKIIKWVGSSPPNGFLRPALDQHAKTVLSRLSAAIATSLKELEAK